MQNFIYPATLTPDTEDDGFVVRFIDLPEAITQGENIEDALQEAADCLEEAIANRIVMELPIPSPSAIKEGQYVVSLPIQMAAKAALYLTIKDHPFTDGNKRIASFLFVYFLDKNNYLYRESGEKKINDNALTALALLIAESDPKEKEQLIALITRLLK